MSIKTDNDCKIENVVVVNDFNFVQGGASKVAIDTANLLAEKTGLSVYFFSASEKKSDELNLKVKDVFTGQGECLKDKNRLRGMQNGLYNKKAAEKFGELLKDLDSSKTIIHIHGWTKSLSSSVMDVAHEMGFLTVITMHDYFTACPNGGYYNFKTNRICNLEPMSRKCIMTNCDSRNYWFKVYRVMRQDQYNKSIAMIKNFIAISDFSLRILKPTLPSGAKVFRINNPIEIPKNIKTIDVSKNKYFLFVGTLSYIKGPDIFCEAVRKAKKQAIVVGDGDMYEDLKEKYPEINFVGWKKHDDVLKYMQGARAVVMPSRWYEGAPLVNVEAIMMGVPVIVSDNSAGSEVGNEKNGTGMAVKNNVDSFVEAFLKVDSIKIKRFDRDKYSGRVYLGKILECYEDIRKGVKNV